MIAGKLIAGRINLFSIPKIFGSGTPCQDILGWGLWERFFEEAVFKWKVLSLLPRPSCVIHFLLNVRFLF